MMGYGYYDGAAWIWMTAMMLLFWGGIVALRRRFALGEINQEEFERMKRTLQG